MFNILVYLFIYFYCRLRQIWLNQCVKYLDEVTRTFLSLTIVSTKYTAHIIVKLFTCVLKFDFPCNIQYENPLYSSVDCIDILLHCLLTKPFYLRP
jgi:hypothetical protein